MWGKWRKLVSEQGRSGQSVAVFCRERGLCAPYFFAWKKRLREADAGQSALRAPLTKFVEVQVAPGGWGQAREALDERAAGVVRGASVAGVAGLHLVGHDVQGYGTAAEVIGDSCLKLWERLR